MAFSNKAERVLLVLFIGGPLLGLILGLNFATHFGIGQLSGALIGGFAGVVTCALLIGVIVVLTSRSSKTDSAD